MAGARHKFNELEVEMIDINELRQSLGAIQTEEVAELLDRLEAAESDALEQARLNGMGSEREAALMAKLEAAEKERDALRAELETERMRLTACGVVALSNTPDSAKWARDIRPEYWSASCGDVARTVDENIKLRAKVEAMEKQEPVAIVDYKRGSCIRWVEYLGWQKIKDGAKLYALPGAQSAPSLLDMYNDMVVGFDYQGVMSCVRQRAKKEAGLLYPEGDARKEEKERELASEYYRQYTTPNTGAKP